MLTEQFGRVLADGGARDGALIFSDGELAAVFVQLTNDDADGFSTPGKWYLEAGFGPCSQLENSTPAPFSTLPAAVVWVGQCLPNEG